VRRKPLVEWKPRFRLRSEERPEPRADFPDLSEGIVRVAASNPGYEVLAIDGLEGGKGKLYCLSVEKVLDKYGINEGKIYELAQHLCISDLRLFRFVIAAAADQSRN
jgi:hypothetical protein